MGRARAEPGWGQGERRSCFWLREGPELSLSEGAGPENVDARGRMGALRSGIPRNRAYSSPRSPATGP